MAKQAKWHQGRATGWVGLADAIEREIATAGWDLEGNSLDYLRWEILDETWHPDEIEVGKRYLFDLGGCKLPVEVTVTCTTEVTPWRRPAYTAWTVKTDTGDEHTAKTDDLYLTLQDAAAEREREAAARETPCAA